MWSTSSSTKASSTGSTPSSIRLKTVAGPTSPKSGADRAVGAQLAARAPRAARSRAQRARSTAMTCSREEPGELLAGAQLAGDAGGELDARVVDRQRQRAQGGEQVAAQAAGVGERALRLARRMAAATISALPDQRR